MIFNKTNYLSICYFNKYNVGYTDRVNSSIELSPSYNSISVDIINTSMYV